MMANSLVQKLKIRDNDILLTLNAPAEFPNNLGKLPAGAKIVNRAKKYNQVHWFVRNKSQLEREVTKVIRLLDKNVIFWVYYPKKSSRLQSDLTRDKGWDSLLKHGDRVTWINLISFDDTWSVFGFRTKSETERKKEAKPKQVREIFNYVNPDTKEITLPDDLARLLKKNKQAAKYFDVLSFTNKKEYIEWIVTAKREETRITRLNGTVERLEKKWKNPRNL